MKKRLLSALMAAAAGFCLYDAYGQSVVMSQDFEGADFPPAGWSLHDADNDGNCWIGYSGPGADQKGSSKKLAISFTRNENYTSLGPQDNWLIMPQFEVANNAYVLSFDYAAQDLENDEPIEVLVSEGGASVEDFTGTLWKSTVSNDYEDNVVISNKSIPLKDYVGKTIRVAFRHKASGTYGLSVDNVFVYNQLGATKPLWIGISAGENGAKSVKLQWRNPSTSGNGQALTELFINVYRDGQKIATLDQSQAIGADVEWTDATVSAGTHAYQLSSMTSEGEGVIISQRSVFVGEDVPAAVKNTFAQADGGNVILTWDAPTTGANKGYVNPDNLEYVITRTVGTAITKVKATGTTYTDTNAPQGVSVLYAVQAVNEAGTSAIDERSAAIVFGDGSADLAVGQTPVRDNGLTRLPVDVTSKYSVSQTIYFPQDLKYAQGDITAVVYKMYHGVDSELSYPVRIYMAETDLNAFDGEWADMTDAKLVYEGNMTTAQGPRDLMVKLDTPFAYKGRNLVVTVIKDGNPNGAYSDRFYSVKDTHANRSFTTSTYDPVDIAKMPHSAYGDKQVAEVPSTRFIVSVKNTGAVEGVVTNAATGAPLADAVVSVAGYEGLKTSTDAGGAYRFPYVPVGEQTLNVEIAGYESSASAVTVADGTTTSFDVKLTRLANYTLSGSVKAGDTGLPAAGAVVRLGGYEEVSATADEKGHWSIDGIYSGKEYTLTVSYPLYAVYESTVSNESETSVEMGEVELERSLIPAYGLNTAVAEDGSAVTLTWKDPTSRDAEAGWKSNGDVSVQSNTSGDWSSTDYNVGHAFTKEEIAELKMTGLSVSAVRVYLEASKGTFTARVWAGTRDDNTVVGSQEIPADKVSPDGSWVTVEFDEPVELREGTDYIIGVNCLNPSSYPVGTAKDNYAKGKNNLKWSDKSALYDGYSAWCIQALCTVPAAEAGIALNEDAPKCAYNVYRSADASAETPVWEKITSAPVNETTYTDGGWSTLMSGAYTYAITAVYQNGESIKAYAPELSRSNDYDTGVEAFITPQKSVDTRETAEVKVKVTNFGEKPLSGFPVSVKLNDGEPMSVTFDGTISKGESAEVTVGTLSLPEDVHTLVAYTSLEGDEVPANDACELTLPNVKNVELKAYRWSAYGYAGFMDVNSNAPESARFVREVTPNDALLIAGEYFDGHIFGYTATWYGASKEFVEIDPVTWTVVRNIENTDNYILDMAYDYKNGTMFGLHPDNEDVWLVKIDTENGTVEFIGNTGVVLRTLACDLNGNLYGVGSDGKFYSVDAATASAEEIGDTGAGKISYLQSMAFDHNTGRLFWAATSDSANGDIYEIDPTTGAATKYGTAMFNGIDPAELVCLYTPYKHVSGGVDSVESAGSLDVSVDMSGNASVMSRADVTLKVFDVAGTAVFDTVLPAGAHNVTLGLQSGVYVMTALSADGSETTCKFVVR